MTTTTVLEVRYAETDMMGIMHHSRYYPWFEVARTDFIKEFGGSYSKMEEAGILMPLTETHAKYLGGLTYEEEAVVVCRLAEMGFAKCKFEYEVYRKSDNKLMTTGYTKHGFVDKDFVPVNLKKKAYDMWELLNSLVYSDEENEHEN